MKLLILLLITSVTIYASIKYQANIYGPYQIKKCINQTCTAQIEGNKIKFEKKDINIWKKYENKQTNIKCDFDKTTDTYENCRLLEVMKWTKINDYTGPKKSGIYAKLSRKKSHLNQIKSGVYIQSNINSAYGNDFEKLSNDQKRYIIDNQEIMRRITQEQLNRLYPVNIPINLKVNTYNVVEFYLFSNGDIKGLKTVTSAKENILNETSIKTIEYAYHRYPRPKQKTLIRYIFVYNLIK